MSSYRMRRASAIVFAAGVIAVVGCFTGPAVAQLESSLLPTGVYEAFQKEGLDPTVVIMIDKAGKEIVFDTPKYPLSGIPPSVSGLKGPHMTIQNLKGSCWKVVCYGELCFAVEYPDTVC